MEPRAPTLLDAVLPVIVLIGLIALTIGLFGVSATDGPLQVALLLSAAFASVMALKNGYRVQAVADAAVAGVSSAMSAIFILLAVGSLIGTWNMAGTIPTVVDYGVHLLNPNVFYLATAAGVYPEILISTLDARYNLNIENAAAGPMSLSIGLIWWGFAILLAIGYFIYLFRSFRGKVTADAEGYGH